MGGVSPQLEVVLRPTHTLRHSFPHQTYSSGLGPYGARQAVSKLGRMRVLWLINDFLSGGANPYSKNVSKIAENMGRVKQNGLARGHVKKQWNMVP